MVVQVRTFESQEHRDLCALRKQRVCVEEWRALERALLAASPCVTSLQRQGTPLLQRAIYRAQALAADGHMEAKALIDSIPKACSEVGPFPLCWWLSCLRTGHSCMGAQQA